MDQPYSEDDALPLSVHAESTLAGEEEVVAVSPNNLVVRLSWMFARIK